MAAYRVGIHPEGRQDVARIAVVAGDGIGTEVVAQGLKVLDVVLPGCETTEYDLGAARYNRTGEVLPDVGAGGAGRASTPSCSARSATRLCRRACLSAVCC